MSKREARPTSTRKYREDRRLEELDHDPYHSKLKLRKPTVCPDCRAIFHRGRWAWGEAPEGAHETRCPACQRIHDKVPAAFVTLGGAFRREHAREIDNLIRNYEAREKAEHPLKRIMTRREHEDTLELTFTDAHLARGIAAALRDAYEGDLDYQYTKGDTMLRVSWSR